MIDCSSQHIDCKCSCDSGIACQSIRVGFITDALSAEPLATTTTTAATAFTWGLGYKFTMFSEKKTLEFVKKYGQRGEHQVVVNHTSNNTTNNNNNTNDNNIHVVCLKL